MEQKPKKPIDKKTIEEIKQIKEKQLKTGKIVIK